MAGIKRKLEGSMLGLDLSYMKNGQGVEQRVPGIIHADDILLLADNPINMQGFMDTCGEDAPHLCKFRPFRVLRSSFRRCIFLCMIAQMHARIVISLRDTD